MAGMGGGGMKNIGGSTDQFYRYKMPGLQRKVCGRGNGIRTQLVNCALVARALHRPAGYVCKFFGCELGAQTKIDDREAMYIVNGAHELDVLEEILSRFVRLFVLCSNCDLPETDLAVDRKGIIKQVCKACGHAGTVDMTHKLCTYIANNPPDGTVAAKAKGRKKEDKNERRQRKAREAQEAQEEEAASKSKSRKDETPQERAARKARKAARKAAAAQSHDGSGDGDDDDEANVTGELPTVEGMTLDDTAPVVDVNPDELQWSVDTSTAAQEARMRELGSAAAILESGKTESATNGQNRTPAPESAPPAPAVPALEVKQVVAPEPVPVPVVEALKAVEDAPRTELASFVAKNEADPLAVGAKALEIYRQDPAAAVSSLLTVMVTPEYPAATLDVTRAVPVLQAIGAPLPSEAQEAACQFMDKLADSSAAEAVPHVLKAFYDNDLVEEEAMFGWSAASSNPVARNAASPFIEWLENAEEESE
ncbi:hypothetical protein I4F81_012172 [Pyropia yezoensis]|uniref:Uncharacterized protein n=1 Tax=Pyropia yezoensis TaxID=2788 RepID=A0ACC3CIQ5_PYRYE|nr:hypothetical protein I4F81_012172 [Neopyropia yezoensis]|eukprot:contig_2793_g555